MEDWLRKEIRMNLLSAQVLAAALLIPMLILIATEHNIGLPKSVPSFFTVGLWIIVYMVIKGE